MSTSQAPLVEDARPAPFGARLSPVDAGTVRVLVRGEVDSVTKDQLAEAFDRVWLTRPTTVIVDLTDVTFLSASGAAVLTQARAVATARGVTVSILSRPGTVRWVVRFAERQDAAGQCSPAAEDR